MSESSFEQTNSLTQIFFGEVEYVEGQQEIRKAHLSFRLYKLKCKQTDKYFELYYAYQNFINFFL